MAGRRNKNKNKKEPQVAGAQNNKQDDTENEDLEDDSTRSTNTDDLIYGYMCDSDDLMDLSEDGQREFLRRWTDAQIPAVKNVLTALKNLELERIETEVEYHQEMAQLELEYHNKLNDLYQERADIIRGDDDPELVEAPWMEKEREKIKESMDKLEEDTKDPDYAYLIEKIKPVPEDAYGIPGFWLQVLKSIDLTGEWIEKSDEPALEKLYDIKVVLKNTKEYVLEFYFEKNEFFTDDKLYKTYKYECDHYKQLPLEYDGPYLKSYTGCKIHWKKGMNLTVKKNKGKWRGAYLEEINSFFNFFQTPYVNDINDCPDDDDFYELCEDFEVAEELKYEIIPNAVLYYAGNIIHESNLYEPDDDYYYDSDLDSDCCSCCCTDDDDDGDCCSDPDCDSDCDSDCDCDSDTCSESTIYSYYEDDSSDEDNDGTTC